MFSDLLQHTISTKRQTSTPEGKKLWAAYLSDIPAMVQPVSERTLNELGITTKAFYVYCDRDQDIAEKDMVVYEGESYSIHTVKDMNFGNSPHFEILVVTSK